MKIVKAEGHGQSECRRCKELGKWSLTWTSFLYKVEGLEGYYCWEHAQEMLKNNGVQLTIYDYLEEDITDILNQK